MSLRGYCSINCPAVSWLGSYTYALTDKWHQRGCDTLACMNTRLSVFCRKVFNKKDIWSIFFCGVDRSSVREFYPGNVCSFQEQRKVPPSNFESFSIFSIIIIDFGWFRIFAFGFPGMCWCHSTTSQLEPLFPHLFSLSPLMISSDRHDSWINMQTQFGLPPPQNLYYALRFRDE